MINTILLILLVIVNYSNFYLTHRPFGRKKRRRKFMDETR